jgi:signal transduction histidine kinase
MKLRTKFVLVLLAVLVLLTGANLAALSLYQDNVVTQERTSVNETANLTANQLEKTIGVRKDRVGVVGQKYPHDDLEGSAAYVSAFLNNTQHFFVGTVVAPNGTVVRAVGQWTPEGREQEVGTNYSDETWFDASSTGRIFVDQQDADGDGAPDLLAVSAPLYDSEGEDVVGVYQVALRIDAISIFSVLGPLETETQTVRVADGDGDVVRPAGNEFDSTITSTARVDGVDWQVTVAQDRSQLDQRLQQLALLQGLSLLVVFVSVIGFGVWEYRSNLRQTERLLQGFETIKGGDYGYRLSLASANEWRQISEGFNDLARGLAFREAQLLEREQRLGVLNRVIRHNVRNEMSVILNYAQLIQETTSDDQAATAADTIVDTGRKLTDLSEKARQIEEALDSADDGLVEQDLVALVEGVVASAREEHDDVDVVFQGPDSMTVAAIPSLEVAIENVVENAAEHNDADEPRVELALGEVVRDGDKRVALKVADNGPGIPEQEKNVLVQGRETALEHGSGLGLWLVYWVIDKSDGSLQFDANDPRGSVVTMELHREPPEDVTPTEPIETDQPAAEIEPELPDGDEEEEATAD